MRKWLTPGIRVKRWFAVSLIGFFVFTVGIMILADMPTHFWELLRERFSVRNTLGVGAAVTGMLGIVFGLIRGFQTMYSAVQPNPTRTLVDMLYERSQLGAGLKIVALGGGTGLSSLLRGLKPMSSNLVAVVTVCDDGGSSGRLSKDLGLLPPGDIRNCLVALADDESLLSELFNHRFQGDNDLGGHSFGNLFLAALTGVVGDFEEAVQVSSQILAIRGKVLPATTAKVTLCARMQDGKIIRGESAIPKSGGVVEEVFLDPPGATPAPQVLSSFAAADAIIFGPGSLFTSVIPNLLVEGMEESLRAVKVPKIYVCNVMTQPGETDDFGAADHLEALERHVGAGVIDTIVINVETPSPEMLRRYEAQGAKPVAPQIDRLNRMGVRVVGANLLSTHDLVRHDSQKLAAALIDLLARQGSRNQEPKKRHLRVVG